MLRGGLTDVGTCGRGETDSNPYCRRLRERGCWLGRCSGGESRVGLIFGLGHRRLRLAGFVVWVVGVAGLDCPPTPVVGQPFWETVKYGDLRIQAEQPDIHSDQPAPFEDLPAVTRKENIGFSAG